MSETSSDILGKFTSFQNVLQNTTIIMYFKALQIKMDSKLFSTKITKFHHPLHYNVKITTHTHFFTYFNAEYSSKTHKKSEGQKVSPLSFKILHRAPTSNTWTPGRGCRFIVTRYFLWCFPLQKPRYYGNFCQELAK